MAGVTDSPVSIVLNKDVVLAPEVIRMFRNIGITHQILHQFELVGIVLSRVKTDDGHLQLRMRVSGVQHFGIPYAQFNEIMELALGRMSPVRTIRHEPMRDVAVYRIVRNIISGSVRLAAGEEVAIRHNGTIKSLFLRDTEYMLSAEDAERIEQHGERKRWFSVVFPVLNTWRVVPVLAYDRPNLMYHLRPLPRLFFADKAIPPGMYTTMALLRETTELYSFRGDLVGAFKWLSYMYRYGELPSACNLLDPTMLLWQAMVKAPAFNTNDFYQFLAFKVIANRGLSLCVTVENGHAITESGPMRLHDFFAQFDGNPHVPKS